MLLSLAPGAAFAVGLDFGHAHIRVAVCDLSGEAVVDDWSPAEVDHAPTESLDLAQELVREALRTAGIERDRLLGVGMYVERVLSEETAALTRNLRPWVTSEYEHNGLRADGRRILDRLFALARGRA